MSPFIIFKGRKLLLFLGSGEGCTGIGCTWPSSRRWLLFGQRGGCAGIVCTFLGTDCCLGGCVIGHTYGLPQGLAAFLEQQGRCWDWVHFLGGCVIGYTYGLPQGLAAFLEQQGGKCWDWVHFLLEDV